MTFIQPNKTSSLVNGLLVILGIALVAGVGGMVVLYNATVNLDHNITAAKAELDAIGAQNTALNNKVIAALSGNNLTAVAAADGLVAEAKPQYFPVNQSWLIASHY